MKKFDDLKEMFLKDLMKLKYKGLYKKYVDDDKELLAEKENMRSEIKEAEQIADLILQNKIELNEINYLDILSFHEGDGETVAHYLAKKNPNHFLFENEEVREIENFEGITVEKILSEK